MSVYASRWALDHLNADPTLGPTARAVLLVLAAEANHLTGEATTSRARLARIVGVHFTTIQRAMRELADVVPCEQVPGKGRRWHFPVSPTVHTGRASASPPLSTPDAMYSTPDAPTRGEGTRPRVPKGGVTTDVEKEGAAAAVANAAQAPGRFGGWESGRRRIGVRGPNRRTGARDGG